MEVVIRNTRGVEGCDFGYSINDSEMIINDGTIRTISKTDGFGVLTSKHIRVDKQEKGGYESCHGSNGGYETDIP